MWIVRIALSFLTKYKWYVVGVGAIGLMASSGWVGYQVAKGLYTDKLEDEIAWYESAIAETQKESEKLAEQSREIETRTRIVREKVIEYVEKNPELNDCELDADGLRLWNGEQ